MKNISTYNKRKIYYFEGDIVQAISNDLKLPKPYFVCSIFLRHSNWDKYHLASLIRRLIQNGGVYFMFHGNRSKEAHNLTDQIAREMRNTKESERNVIMTTWYEKEPIKEVIFNTFCTAWPANDYEKKFTSYLIFSFGSKNDNLSIRKMLKNIEATITKISEE